MKYRLLLPICLSLTLAAHAELAVSTNDAHMVLINGVNMPVKDAPPDTLAIIDLAVSPPKLVAEIDVPGSVIGPPFSVAVTPDESLALVTACMKVDPADPTKSTEDNRLSVVDLKARPPRLLTTMAVGKGPAGMTINREGNLAMVANRGDGSISAFTIKGQTVTKVETLSIGNAASALGMVAITPDSKHALVSFDGENRIVVLNIDLPALLSGTVTKAPPITLAGRDLKSGIRPYGMNITKDGHYAVVGNVGNGNGDTDTVGLIDLAAQPARVVDLAPVPQTPEGIKLSPDGTICAVLSMDGSNQAPGTPFYHDHGQLLLFRLSNGKFTPLAHALTGHMAEGVAFSADGKTILVGNMVEKNIQVFSWDGKNLRDTGVAIPLKAGSAAIATAQ